MSTLPTGIPVRRPVLRAAAWMSGALVSFLAMALGGRELSAGLSTFQILFFRSLVGLCVIGLVALRTGWAPLRTTRFGLHLGRNVAHFAGQFGWFFAIGLMPLAQVFAIEFTIPIWTALLAAAFLGERITGRRVVALVVGISGVLMILRPGAGILQPAALAALGGTLAYAVSYVLTKQLTRTDSALSVLFYMTLVQLPLGLVGAALQWRPVTPPQLPWLIVVGVSALSAHYCLTRALKLAEVNIVLPMDFLRLPLVAVLGFLLYGEQVDALFVAGTLAILSANFVNLSGAKNGAKADAGPGAPG